MYKIEIYVKLKKDVLDPQGKAIAQAAKSLNIKDLIEVKQGKYFEIIINNVNDIKGVKSVGNQISKKLLCNEVIEDYEVISIKKV